MINYLHPSEQWKAFEASDRLVKDVGAFAYNSMGDIYSKEQEEKEFIAQQEAKGYYCVKKQDEDGYFFIHRESQAKKLIERIEAKKKVIDNVIKDIFNPNINIFDRSKNE